MKQLLYSLKANYFAMLNLITRFPKFLGYSLLLGSIFIIGCNKEDITESNQDLQLKSAVVTGNILLMYDGVDKQTMWELQQARAASARYKHIKNALKDGYADINVIIPYMGYHYMRSTSLDANFNFRDPEILVYNKDDNGEFQLVAVEYAVPINLSPNLAPAGFTGNADVWTRNEGFGLWLLHAWVWFYNPAGVFNPTNANIVLQ